MERVQRGTRVVPLTAELAEMLHEDSQQALGGDGSCTLRNMNVSCFAAEHCAKGGHGTSSTLRSLLGGGYAFVCIDDTYSPPRFVGCVQAKLCPSYVAAMFPPDLRPRGLVLFSLCVDDRYRRQHVGARLVQRVLDVGCEAGLSVHLLVDKGRSATGECVAAFHDRVPRLRETYARLGWAEECESDDYILFRQPRGPPTSQLF